MVENYVLRQKARKQLGDGIFKTPWLLMLVVCLIYSAITSVGGAIPTVGSIAVLILTGPLNWGLVYTTLACARGEKWGVESLFEKFGDNFGNKIALGIVQAIFIILWTLLFIIPGLVKMYAYSMSWYIYKDHPELGATECITASRQMMDGYKMQLFLLDLSFIGWYLLGALCFGVGVLFVVPYHEVARANFYQELCAQQNWTPAPAPAAIAPAEEVAETPVEENDENA